MTVDFTYETLVGQWEVLELCENLAESLSHWPESGGCSCGTIPQYVPGMTASGWVAVRKAGPTYHQHAIPLACEWLESAGHLPAGTAGIAAQLVYGGFAGFMPDLRLAIDGITWTEDAA